MNYIIDLIVKNYQVIIPFVLLVISEAIAASKLESNSVTELVIKLLKYIVEKKK